MDWTFAEQKLAALKSALEEGDPAAAYLCCAQLWEALLLACYRKDGIQPPPPEQLFANLPKTGLGERFRIHFDAYLRVCIRLDGVCPGRKAEDFPQYTDARRLLDRMQNC